MELQDDVNQVVIHELIHAYDECRAANLDWSNCAHHACSQIRDGHLSGDCHYKRELLRGFMKIRELKDCVRRRVMKSMTSNPFCSETPAKDAMEAVLDICYNDTKPFDSRQSSLKSCITSSKPITNVQRIIMSLWIDVE
ncbi:hypothetical protein HRI_000415500 [Hibiscus trionum]|uniref:Mitochondrial inner membrane protease ATP23 n=1 Tax=Hibiscus trionum TaxID=183268 RepID=A0A9W7GXP9_HIBTR|nr:hypothetical protein HRI_000415500 [Hibiscus trionum]